MTPAAVDRLLAVLVLAMAATGLATLRAGTAESAWLFVVHGILAGSLALTVAIKLRQSVGKAVRGRRWGRLALGMLVGLVAAAALSGGYLWVASGELLSIRGWTILTLHAWAGLVLVPLVVLHVVPRRWRLLAPRPRARAAGRAASRVGATVRRRTVLAAAALAAVGVGAWATAEVLDRARGGTRRFTGSRPLPSGGVPPPTTFFGEPPPDLDLAAWRLAVRGHVSRPLSLDAAALAGLGTTTRVATLDCTSGWAMETDWTGTPLAAVLDAAGIDARASEVLVRSATGWTAILPLTEARGCLLAVGVAGAPLPVGNGRPCRLVAPDRRGLDWVKWVVEIEVA